MNHFLKELAYLLGHKLLDWSKPNALNLVKSLIMSTASLELRKDEYVELSPTKGACGPFKLSGNSLPVIEYLVFEKKLMEFIQVRVELSFPDRISYSCQITSKDHEDNRRHGDHVETKEEYKKPFEKLAFHLYRYFPFYKKHKSCPHKEVRNGNTGKTEAELREPSEISIQDGQSA